MKAPNSRVVGVVLYCCFAFSPSVIGEEVEIQSVCDGSETTHTHSLSRDDINTLIDHAKSGNADAAYMVAQYYSHSDEKPSETRRWLKVANSNQCLMAKYRLGISYLRGKTDYIGDVTKGERLLAEVYEQGFTDAAMNLGYFYNRGKTKNYKKSRYWFKKAAAVGHTDAMYQLTQLYLAGKGGKKQPQKVYALSLLLSTRVAPTSEMWKEFSDWRVQAVSQLSVSEIEEATDLFLNALWVLPCAPESDGAYCLEIEGDEANRRNRQKRLEEWRSNAHIKLFENSLGD